MKPDGYATKVSGQLLHVDASTSLQVIYHYANFSPRFSNAMTVSFFLLRQYQQFVYGAERDGPLQIGRFQDEQQQQIRETERRPVAIHVPTSRSLHG